MTIDSREQRRERERQQRREDILDAAERVFLTKGYERCTMEDIASAAGLSRALLYVYFRDKSAMLRALMLRAAEALLARFRAAISAADSGAAQLSAIGYAYYRFSLEDSHYFDMLTQAGTASEPGIAAEELEALERCDRQTKQLMMQSLQRGIEDGTIDAQYVPDLMTTALFLRGALHGMIMQTREPERADPDSPPAETLIRYSLEQLGRSLRS